MCFVGMKLGISVLARGPGRAWDPLLEGTQEDGKTGESLGPNSLVRQCGCRTSGIPINPPGGHFSIFLSPALQFATLWPT